MVTGTREAPSTPPLGPQNPLNINEFCLYCHEIRKICYKIFPIFSPKFLSL
jgi:hypothetical protein